ncbi:hypothetical protein ACTFIZ_002576 [Dictyostelium cf. discoideum]
MEIKKSIFRLFIFLLVCTIVLSNSIENYGTVIGIDLGTTYCSVGVFKNNNVRILTNEQGNRITPSYVAFTKNERLIGEAAKAQANFNPENTIFDIKRLIGREFDEDEVQKDIKFLPFKVISKNNKPYIVVKVKQRERIFSPEEILAMILVRMKDIAEFNLGEKISYVVLTCPAYFNDAQRSATKVAGEIAGLQVLRVINEPTAATLSYGFKNGGGYYNGDICSEEKKVLVYDLGGGTCDVSMVSLEKEVYQVLATNGETHLGGEDFNHNIMDYLLTNFKNKTGKDASSDKKALQKLRNASENAKITLTTSLQTKIEIENFFDGIDLIETLSRSKFEELNMELFKKTLKPVKNVLDDTGLKKSQIDEIVLVGGSTRIPKIRQMLKEFFNGKELNLSVHPDEAVAYGAAIQGGILTNETGTKYLALLDIAPITLGIESVGGLMAQLIPKGTPIPTKKSQIFSTYQDNQEMVSIQIYEGEHSITKHNGLLGRFDLSGILPSQRGVPKIEVTFKIDVDGILHVSALDKESGSENSITFKNDKYRFSKVEIGEMVKEIQGFAAEDKINKERVESKNTFENFIYHIKNIISDREKSNVKLDSNYKETIEILISDSLSWLEDNHLAKKDEIDKKYKIIQKIVKPIFEYNILLELRSQMNYVRDDKNNRVIEFEDGLEMTIFKNNDLSCKDIELTSNDNNFSTQLIEINKPNYSFPFLSNTF